jgi:hypothetical protein
MKQVIFAFAAMVILAAACRRNNSGSNDQIGTTLAEPKKDIKTLLARVSENKGKISNGDLIERTDDGLASETVRSMSQKDKSFSHCGIAFIEDGEIYVYNTMAGEENPGEKMLRERYDSFVSPYRKAGFGVFRYTLTGNEVEKLHQLTKESYQKGLLFDKTFDLKTDDKMYCAELILKMVKTATDGRVMLPTSKLQNFRVRDPKYKGLILKEFEYVGLDDLFLNPFCREIVRVSYK